MIFGSGPIPFLACFSLGVGLGFVFLLLRVIQKKLKFNKILKHVLDCLFAFLSAFLFFLTCFHTLEGEFRLFTLIGFGFGFGASFLLSRLFKKLQKKKKGKNQKQ